MGAFIVSLGAFVPGLFGKQISQKLAKGIGIAVLIALLAAVLAIGKCSYDASVIETHEAAQKVKDAEAVAGADRDADTATEPDVQAFQNEQIRIDEAMTEAARSDPKGAASTVGPVTRSYYDTLPPAKEKRR